MNKSKTFKDDRNIKNVRIIGGADVNPGGGGTAQNAVKFIPQALSELQKAQARMNIGAASDDDVREVSEAVAEESQRAILAETNLQQMIAAIQGVRFVMVDVLPPPSAETAGGKIYLVPNNDPATDNTKDEYVTVYEGSAYRWEKIGSTSVDMDGYPTDEELEEALETKQDTVQDLSEIRSGAAAGATAYQKPQTGIPASDLASDVIPTVPTDVVKYSSQSLSDEQKEQARINIAAAAASSIAALETALAAKYTMPSGGIPSTDMDAAVQNALAKAMTAVQSLADYYTKDQVDAITAAIAAMVNSMAGETVTSLPTASSETLGTMYYVGPDENDEYERYFTSFDGTSYYWTSIGSTAITLSNYAQKDETIILSDPVEPDSDIEIGDNDRNVILRISNGVVTTKAFDSSKLHTVPDKSILCIGDSLTMGTGSGKIYPLYLQELVGDDYVVDNLGEGGDKIQDIMARTNAFPAVTAGAFTIPASGSVSIGGLISSYDYARKINLLKQSQAVFNPVEIMGVKGYLAASGNYEAVTYTFTRLSSGTSVNVPKWTPVYGNEGLNLGNSKVLILWGGQNGLFSDEDELVAMDKAVVEAMGIQDYCVIGPTNNNYQYDAFTRCVFDYDTLTAKMRNQFGCHYIDMLGYFLTDALSDAGITPTAADTAAIANDKVPPSLLADTVHFNATGFELVANKIYEVLKQLNYL